LARDKHCEKRRVAQGCTPEEEYGGDPISLWDRGAYETEKWWEDEITVSLKDQSGY
jgi:hypothetical protein